MPGNEVGRVRFGFLVGDVEPKKGLGVFELLAVVVALFSGNPSSPHERRERV